MSTSLCTLTYVCLFRFLFRFVRCFRLDKSLGFFFFFAYSSRLSNIGNPALRLTRTNRIRGAGVPPKSRVDVHSLRDFTVYSPESRKHGKCVVICSIFIFFFSNAANMGRARPTCRPSPPTATSQSRVNRSVQYTVRRAVFVSFGFSNRTDFMFPVESTNISIRIDYGYCLVFFVGFVLKRKKKCLKNNHNLSLAFCGDVNVFFFTRDYVFYNYIRTKYSRRVSLSPVECRKIFFCFLILRIQIHYCL